MFVVMEKTSETFFIKKPLTYAMLKHLEKMIIFPPLTIKVSNQYDY